MVRVMFVENDELVLVEAESMWSNETPGIFIKRPNSNELLEVSTKSKSDAINLIQTAWVQGYLDLKGYDVRFTLMSKNERVFQVSNKIHEVQFKCQ